ncbi:MAG TPA: flagellar basal body rod protein FlgF [Pusillimonas sp.]|uniref:flagellar basal body rod protein FlgF n=1 Tax=unclassified Pusillimonas TaxID=2640016 RepID=UPI00260C0F49|nr:MULTISPECIES: flagellar basal body rod protein FlgF [unclassified Pusillimonas]HLU18539.1 flagellar basal body rod protein FlgF [Pusillimonas sp.]
MDRLVYTAVNGANRVLDQQAVLTNNLANVGTAGFREQLINYRSVPVMAEQGLPTRVSTVATTPGSNMRPGIMTETGRALDVAITGDGWFSVQTPNGEAFTRAGEFSINTEGMLVNRDGYLVMSADNVPIQIPDRGIVTITGDGTITAIGAGDNPNDIQNVAQLKLSKPQENALIRGADGYFRANPDIEPFVPANPDVRVVSGYIENSNVSAAETMVALIENARRFEMQMKVIRDASSIAQDANSILSAGN